MIKNPSSHELIEIGAWENRLMWSALVMVVLTLISRLILPEAGLLIYPVIFFQIYSVYRLGTAAEMGWITWAVLLLTIIPLIGLAGIAFMVVLVNQLFKQRSIPVGLMGPRLDQIAKDAPSSENSPDADT